MNFKGPEPFYESRMPKQVTPKQLPCLYKLCFFGSRVQPDRRLPITTQHRVGGSGWLLLCSNILVRLHTKPHSQKQPKHSRCKSPQKASKVQTYEPHPHFGRKSAPLTLAGTLENLASCLALCSIKCSVILGHHNLQTQF